MTLPGETVGTGGAGPEKDPNIVGPKIMQSGGGYYVGYGYVDPEYGFEEPYSRESGYYATKEQAQEALDYFMGPTPKPDLNPHARGTQYDPQGDFGVEVVASDELDFGLDI